MSHQVGVTPLLAWIFSRPEQVKIGSRQKKQCKSMDMVSRNAKPMTEEKVMKEFKERKHAV